MLSNYWEKDFNLSTDPVVRQLLNKIYNQVFDLKSIEVLNENPQKEILDTEFHIDTILHTRDGLSFTVQEKIRRHEYFDFHDFTLEYESNTKTHIKGEYFKLCTDFYTYGWINEDKTDFLELYIFKVLPFKMALLNNWLKYEPQLNLQHSLASFLAFKFDQFPNHWFLYKHSMGKKFVHELI